MAIAIKTEVVDADGHVVENVDEIFEFLEAPYAGKQQLYNHHQLWPSLDGYNRAAMAAQYDIDTPLRTTPEMVLEMLDEVGATFTVLYPTFGLAHGLIRQREWSVALARAYNSWMAERYAKTDSRLKWVAILPLQDPSAAAEELRRAVTELGAVGGMLTGAGLTEPLGAASFAPMYAEANDLGTALICHAAPASALPDIFTKFTHLFVLNHPVAQMTQMASMFQAGVIDKYTNIRFGYFEAGMSWVPHVLGRLERTTKIAGMETEPAYATSQRKNPRDHIRDGRIFFSLEGEEPLIGPIQDYLGADCLCFASDFPHENGTAARVRHEMDEIEELVELSDKTRAGILGGNARRLYGI
jgi:predicted TIM-barrel fold metal-dependent hydrolase